jgi:hypothetical protein
MVLLLQPTKTMKPIPLPLPLQEELHKFFEYEEGNLYWKFKPNRRIKIGSKAGYLHSTGYVHLRINSVSYKMHRIIWAYHYGAIPSNLQIDHIDGDRVNNTIGNLRLATQSQNKSNNKRAYRNSKSNILGVYWVTRDKKWSTEIRLNGKTIRLGYFVNQKDAIAARKTAELQYFGEFAP